MELGQIIIILVQDPIIHEALMMWISVSEHIFGCLDSSNGGEMEDASHLVTPASCFSAH